MSRLCLSSLAFLACAFSPIAATAGVPLTDVIFFGRVYNKTTHQAITGTLPGPITVKINNATGPADPVVFETTVLKNATGGSDGLCEFYVVRLRRFDTGTSRTASDTFVLPYDRIHIYLNGVEVNETANAAVPLVNDAAMDVRRLSLNSPVTDSDGDGIADNWETTYFGGLSRTGLEDLHGDGVSVLMAYALGLNPNDNNTSRMPTLQVETNGDLAFYFRQSTTANATLVVETTDRLNGGVWLTIPGLTPQAIGTDGSSRILKVVIPGGPSSLRRFYRLTAVP